ncbi:MAG: hypothetical protein J7M34_08275 [Anaerolineae bacterium]|nr:hypothetical protein [Anaerolineae bacterium]
MANAIQSSTSATRGLEGVVVTTTQLSKVDGTAGRLYYRGYSIDHLAKNASFEEVAYLLWAGHLPNASEISKVREDLVACRTAPSGLVDALRKVPLNAPPMTALRSIISLLGHYDPDAEDNGPEASMRKAYRLTSQMATLVAAFDQIRKGKDPIPPRQDLNHAANFLYMLTGEEPSDIASRALETYLILLADHGFNASTFAARVTASTLSDMHSAIVSAIGTLKGPLHGAANQRALEQFLEIGDVENVKPWFEKAKAEKRRIMGVGHRVYKVVDPRARYLRQMALQLSGTTGNPQVLDIALKLEEVVSEDPYFVERKLYPNVDYYSAPALYMLGIDADLFPTLFAMSRVVGWTAHVMEQWANNRLIRPRAQFIGDLDLPWVPLEERP